ncbi:MAG TPA: hypothetical protein DIT43_01905 [Dehalococcoidia bacterium]|nr:hypothetical protein [Dehalococcoidia bacterium]
MSGTYIDITEIVAPYHAVAGEVVGVTVKAKNKWTSSVHVYMVAVLDSELRFIDWQDYWISAGATHSFTGSFVMPAKDVNIHAYAYYEGTDGYLHMDDGLTKGVYLAEAFEGAISKMELEYDESRASIPAYNIPQNDRGLVHVWGRNDMDSAQRLGIWWRVKDPDGVTVEEYAAWEAWPYTGAGSAHEFIGGRFSLDKPGAYSISVQLFMNPDAQVMVDSYSGTLCAVVSTAPVFSSLSIKDYVKV